MIMMHNNNDDNSDIGNDNCPMMFGYESHENAMTDDL